MSLNITDIVEIIGKISAGIPRFGVSFNLKEDQEYKPGRMYIQCAYQAPCTVSKEEKTWHGRKWYLSKHMTEDEIVKTCYAAFKATVEHEVMEGFTYEGVRVFNPHVNFRALMAVSNQEVFREKH